MSILGTKGECFGYKIEKDLQDWWTCYKDVIQDNWERKLSLKRELVDNVLVSASVCVTCLYTLISHPRLFITLMANKST